MATGQAGEHPPPILYPADVARIWSEEAGRDISVTTVYNYLKLSRPADPQTGRKAGRYAGRPVPLPANRAGYVGNPQTSPYWLRKQEKELRAWWHGRWGQGARTDLVKPKPPRRKK